MFRSRCVGVVLCQYAHIVYKIYCTCKRNIFRLKDRYMQVNWYSTLWWIQATMEYCTIHMMRSMTVHTVPQPIRRMSSMNKFNLMASKIFPGVRYSEWVYKSLLCIHMQVVHTKLKHWVLYVFRLISVLGSGQFGSVSKGVWRYGVTMKEVVVKTLTDSANIVKFFQEAAIMAQFRHPNVVALYGVVICGKPVSNV